MAETFKEQVARVRMMAIDDGGTWDLSDNDQAALTAVLKNLDDLSNVHEVADPMSEKVFVTMPVPLDYADGYAGCQADVVAAIDKTIAAAQRRLDSGNETRLKGALISAVAEAMRALREILINGEHVGAGKAP